MDPETNDTNLFEEQLRALTPKTSGSSLQARIAKDLESNASNQRHKWVALSTLAAAIVIGMVTIVLRLVDGPDSLKISENESGKQVGRQHFIVESSEPVLIKIPDSPPMWQIDLKLLNRDFIETPNGVIPSDFVAENRSVFLPVVYQ